MNIIPNLNLNEHPKDIKNGSFVNARDVMINNHGTISNENAFIEQEVITNFLNTIDANIVGHISCNHELVIFLDNGNILRYNEDKNKLKVVVNDFKYNGGKIKGSFSYNGFDELIIVFSQYDGNIKTPLATYNLKKFDDNTIDIIQDYRKSYLVPEVKIPYIKLDTIVDTWYKGWSFIFIRYKIDKYNTYTQWYCTNANDLIDSSSVRLIQNRGGYVHNTDEKSNDILTAIGNSQVLDVSANVSNDLDFCRESRNININELDTNYSFYQLGVIVVRKDKISAYTTNDIDIDTNNIKLNKINFINTTDVTGLITTYYNYYNVKNITTFKNRFYFANYEETDDLDLNNFVKSNVDVDIVKDIKKIHIEQEGTSIFNINALRLYGSYTDVLGQPMSHPSNPSEYRNNNTNDIPLIWRYVFDVYNKNNYDALKKYGTKDLYFSVGDYYIKRTIPIYYVFNHYQIDYKILDYDAVENIVNNNKDDIKNYGLIGWIVNSGQFNDNVQTLDDIYKNIIFTDKATNKDLIQIISYIQYNQYQFDSGYLRNGVYMSWLFANKVYDDNKNIITNKDVVNKPMIGNYYNSSESIITNKNKDGIQKDFSKIKILPIGVNLSIIDELGNTKNITVSANNIPNLNYFYDINACDVIFATTQTSKNIFSYIGDNNNLSSLIQQYYNQISDGGFTTSFNKCWVYYNDKYYYFDSTKILTEKPFDNNFSDDKVKIITNEFHDGNNYKIVDVLTHNNRRYIKLADYPVLYNTSIKKDLTDEYQELKEGLYGNIYGINITNADDVSNHQYNPNEDILMQDDATDIDSYFVYLNDDNTINCIKYETSNKAANVYIYKGIMHGKVHLFKEYNGYVGGKAWTTTNESIDFTINNNENIISAYSEQGEQTINNIVYTEIKDNDVYVPVTNDDIENYLFSFRRQLIPFERYNIYIHFVDKFGISTKGYFVKSLYNDFSEYNYTSNNNIDFDLYSILKCKVNKIHPNYIGWYLSYEKGIKNTCQVGNMMYVFHKGEAKTIVNIGEEADVNAAFKYILGDSFSDFTYYKTYTEYKYSHTIRFFSTNIDTDDYKNLSFSYAYVNNKKSFEINTNNEISIYPAGSPNNTGQWSNISIPGIVGDNASMVDKYGFTILLKSPTGDVSNNTKDKELIPLTRIFYTSFNDILYKTEDAYYPGFKSIKETYFSIIPYNIDESSIWTFFGIPNNNNAIVGTGVIRNPWVLNIPDEYKQFKSKPYSLIYSANPTANQSEQINISFNAISPANSRDLFVQNNFSYEDAFPKVQVNYRTDLKTRTEFNNVIRRSIALQDESATNSFRNIVIDDYYNIYDNKGFITNICNSGNVFIVHTQCSLYILDGSNRLNGTNGQTYQLEDKDIFNVSYKEVFSSKLGYGGLQDSDSWHLGEYGYIWYNDDTKSFMTLNNNSSAFIGDNIDEWCKKNDLRNVRFYNDVDRYRLIIKGTINDNYIIWMSFNYKLNCFVSFHTYSFDKIFETENNLYLFNNKKCSIFDKATYTDKNTSISIIYNESYDVIKFIEYISYNLKAVARKIKDVYGILPVENGDRLYAGNSLRVFNDWIDTNNIDLHIKESDINKVTEYNKPYRHFGNWNVNLLRDIYNSTNNALLDNESTRLYGNYFIITFEFDKPNTDNNYYEFNDVNLKINTL